MTCFTAGLWHTAPDMAPKRKPKFVLDTSALLTMMKEAPGGAVGVDVQLVR
ncbi:MAG: hypothetical protein V3T72_05900 [Thermoanaerobaculia bacterium]